MKAEQEITASVSRPQNTFNIEHIRDGEVIGTRIISNGVTIAGFNSLLNTYFGAEAKKVSFYIGLINTTGFTAVAEADTMASHAGWAEFTTYDETTRPEWIATTATNKSVTGQTVQTFTIGTVAAQSIEGLFVTDNNVKGGATGYLWATALYIPAEAVITGDTFRITYTLRFSN